jgi:hypothetical protein
MLRQGCLVAGARRIREPLEGSVAVRKDILQQLTRRLMLLCGAMK